MSTLRLKCRNGRIVPVRGMSIIRVLRCKQLLKGKASPADEHERDFLEFLRLIIDQ